MSYVDTARRGVGCYCGVGGPAYTGRTISYPVEPTKEDELALKRKKITCLSRGRKWDDKTQQCGAYAGPVPSRTPPSPVPGGIPLDTPVTAPPAGTGPDLSSVADKTDTPSGPVWTFKPDAAKIVVDALEKFLVVAEIIPPNELAAFALFGIAGLRGAARLAWDTPSESKPSGLAWAKEQWKGKSLVMASASVMGGAAKNEQVVLVSLDPNDAALQSKLGTAGFAVLPESAASSVTTYVLYGAIGVVAIGGAYLAYKAFKRG